MRQISLMLLGLGLVCGSAYAAHMDETPMPLYNDIPVTAPEQSAMWSFGLTAVLMQPVNNTFEYANDFDSEYDDSEAIAMNNYSVNPAYHWWFGADVTYAFAGSGRDITLAYEGLQGNDSNSTTSEAGFLNSTFDGDAESTPIYAQNFTTALGKTMMSYDALDLVFGQNLDVGQRLRLHPFMGVRYGYISVENTGLYTGGQFVDNIDGFFDPTRTSDATENSMLKNTFRGVGPRLGTDAEVNVGRGFSVRGRLGLSALIGPRDTRANTDYTFLYNVDDDGFFPQYAANVPYDRSTDLHVVPEIDGRLGIHYTYNFDATTVLGFEAGWQATNYFNVIAQEPAQYVNQTYGGSSANFGMQGPYARIQMDIV